MLDRITVVLYPLFTLESIQQTQHIDPMLARRLRRRPPLGRCVLFAGRDQLQYTVTLAINPLSPHDALKHHITSLGTDLIFLQLRVLV